MQPGSSAVLLFFLGWVPWLTSSASKGQQTYPVEYEIETAKNTEREREESEICKTNYHLRYTVFSSGIRSSILGANQKGAEEKRGCNLSVAAVCASVEIRRWNCGEIEKIVSEHCGRSTLLPIKGRLDAGTRQPYRMTSMWRH
jgi:hypothetical protein